MKATLILRILPLIFSILILGPNLETYAQINSTFSRPGNSLNFNHNGSSWIHNSNSVYTYNTNGQLILKLTTALSTSQNIFKNEVSYDQQGREKENLYFNWRNNNWQLDLGYRDSMIYDLNNRIVQQTSSSFNYGNWETQKFDNTYDPSGNLTQQLISYFNNGTWELRGRKTFTYVNGLNTEELIEVLTRTVWQNYAKYVYAGWHTQIAQPTSYTLYAFDITTNQWYSYGRNTITLTANGGYIILRESLQGNIWVSEWRNTYTRDFRGNDGGYTSEDYKNGAWLLSDGMEINLTYNNLFDITERIYRYRDIFSPGPYGPFIDQRKEVYSNFQYFNISGIKNEIPEEIGVNVFPNPVQHTLNIELAEKAEIITAQLSDLTGKIVLNKNFQSSEAKQLNLENLKAGIYLLHLETRKGKTVQKIIKN